MSHEEKSSNWYEVLTGKADPATHEEQILARLRELISRDQAKQGERLSELDLKRGQQRLRAALVVQHQSEQPWHSRRSFLSGLAAGVAAMGIVMVSLQQPDIPVPDGSKGLPVGIADVQVQRETLGEVDPDITVLARVLIERRIAFSQVANNDILRLSFTMPAQVPDELRQWLDSNSIEVRGDATYRIEIDLEKE